MGVEEAVQAANDQILGLIVGVLAVSLFAITVAALGIRMGINWLKYGSVTGASRSGGGCSAASNGGGWSCACARCEP